MTREEAKDKITELAKENFWGCGECLEALGMAIKALEQQRPYEKFESVKDHICKLAGDYKCWDNRLTPDEALELCRMLEQEPILDKIYADIQKLRGCSCSCSDGIIDDIEDILDKYKAESEEK